MEIESGSNKILNVLKKEITIEQVKKTLQLVNKAKVETTGSFIIGTPGKTMNDVKQTINFAKSCGVDYAQFTVMTSYPGTEVYEMTNRDGASCRKGLV